MRITKEPEERRQEILDMAMKLFSDKGYEQTSITDIARAIGVAQGLCYRYFPSKEALFDCAVERYADELAGRLSLQAGRPGLTLKELIETMTLTAERPDSPYYGAFHAGENKKFHGQLVLAVCEKLSKTVLQLLSESQKRGEIRLKDLHTAASFCVYGQIGILLDKDLTPEEKTNRIRAFLLEMLGL